MSNAVVVILVADGLRPDVLDAAIRSGDVPELAALQETNGAQVVTTVFPSVTGAAYVPMLTGLHPADAGLPGLRWYDRSRRVPALLGHARSYVGVQARRIDHDLVATARTAFELVDGHALGSAAMVTRGLPRRNRLERGPILAARALHAHLRGDVRRWAAIEEELASALVDRIRRERPRFVFASFTTGDKAAHAHGAEAAEAARSLRLVDDVARSIRLGAERDGWSRDLHLWIVSDHGHAPVQQSWDLADAMRGMGIRVRAHPWTIPDRSEAAVMVSGNSMAHVYLGLGPTRANWPALEPGWRSRIDALWRHPAIDLIATKLGPGTVGVSRRGARALIRAAPRGFTYLQETGNPLGIEPFERCSADEAHERSADGPYPDAVVQLARLVLADRSGDLVLSASPGWDLRRRYEPIAHVSSHGALHATQMLVPLVGNRRFPDRPRRTADLYRWLASILGHERRNGSA